MIHKLFTEHPKSVNETYWQHFRCAFKYGIMMIIGGSCCVIHAVLPLFFKKTASTINTQIYQDLKRRHDCQEVKPNSQ